MRGREMEIDKEGQDKPGEFSWVTIANSLLWLVAAKGRWCVGRFLTRGTHRCGCGSFDVASALIIIIIVIFQKKYIRTTFILLYIHLFTIKF